MPDYRGRDGMNMGHMGNMGPRPLDLPPMDMRRMDGPPGRARDMDPRDMRNREPNRDFFRSGEEPDFSLRRQYETAIREKLMNSSGFLEPGRNLGDVEGRGMPPREPNVRFMGEPFQHNMPHFNNPNVDGRRGGFPVDRWNDGRKDGYRDTRDRPPVDYDMDLPPHDRRMLDTERRGGSPFNQRGGFRSDTDFRNRLGPPAEFRGRDRSPLRFGNSDVSAMDRERSDMTSDVAGPRKSEFMGVGDTLQKKEYPHSSGSPIMDYRSGDEMTLAEEWKNRQKDKNTFPTVGKSVAGIPEANFPVGFSRDVNVRDSPSFQEKNSLSSDFPGKDVGFPHVDHFPAVNHPSVGNKLPKHGESDLKHSPNTLNREERTRYQKESNQPSREIQIPSDCFRGLKDLSHNQGPARSKIGAESDTQPRDQDYRDIDYRTGSGRTFDYKHEPLEAPEKLIKETKPSSPSRFSESGPKVGLF